MNLPSHGNHLYISLVVFLLGWSAHSLALDTLGVSDTTITPSLQEYAVKNNKKTELLRIKESMDNQLIHAIKATRKFDVIARSDLDKIFKEQDFVNSGSVDSTDKNAAQSFQIAGVKYLLTVAIDDFQDILETAEFANLGKTATRRTVRVGAVGKIYDSTSGKLLESASFQFEQMDPMTTDNFIKSENNLSDQLLTAMATDLSAKIANRLVEVLSPAKVLTKTDNSPAKVLTNTDNSQSGWSAHSLALDTLGISDTTITPSLQEYVVKNNKKTELLRIKESLDNQLIHAIKATRKFDVIARSDLDKIFKEQDFVNSGSVDSTDKNAAQSFQIAGVKYLLTVAIDDFQDIVETAKFANLGKTATRRTVRVGAVGKVYDSTSGKLLESASFQFEQVDPVTTDNFVESENNLSDQLLTAIATDLSAKIANRVVEVLNPAKVLTKTYNQVTINRGDGTDIKVGEVWLVYALGEALIDPDTGENLGAEEIQVGKVRITQVTAKFSKAEVMEDNGIAKGSILRKQK